MVAGLTRRWLISRSVKKPCRVGAIEVIGVPPAVTAGAGRRPAPAVRVPPTGTSYSDVGITGITPISGLFRYLLLCARDGPVAWDDVLWRLSPVGIIRCHSLSPHRRWMMSSRSCHN